MYNSASFGKRAFTMAIVFATILWSVGVSFFAMPFSARAATLEDGDLIKGSLSTVYYYWDEERYTFPNEKTFMTWFADFDDVEEIDDTELADIPLAGNIAYRPGTYMIKIDSDPKAYVVGRDGEIRWVETEEVAEDLFGEDWSAWIHDVPDVFFVDYSEGSSLMEAELVDGMLVTDGTETYLVWDGMLRSLTEDGMDANRLWETFVMEDSSVDLADYEEGDEIDSEVSSVSDASQLSESESEEEEEAGSLEISLASTSPDSSTVVAGQAIADLAHFEFENTGDSDVSVTSLALDRDGVSSDTTLSAVYLFDDGTASRLTDSATVSSGTITFNDTSGLFTVEAGETAIISVRSDIATGTSGQTLGVSIESASSVTAGDAEVDGDFPVEGDIHTVATATLATVDFATSTTPSTASIDPENDYTVWQNVTTIGNTKVNLMSMRFRQIGSINDEDIENFRLYVDGTMVGEAVEALDENGYVTFDLSDDPQVLDTGSRTIKVLADIIGGTTRTVQMSLRSTADLWAEDYQYDQAVLATAASSAFSSRDAGAQTINSGTLTITKTSTSPSGNVTIAGSSVTIGEFTMTAAGERMKVESMRLRIDEANTVTTGDDDTSGADSIYTLRNGAVYADGVQVGSTTAIAGDGDATLAYTQYNFGSSLIVEPGDPVTMTVKADIYDNDTTNDIDATDTLQLEVATGSSNVLRMTSNSYASLPATAVEMNTLTVAAGNLTVAAYSAYTSQTAVAPKTAYRIGAFVITATTTEDVNINTFTLTDTVTDAALASADLTNLYLTYGATGTETTSAVKATVSDTSNAWSVNYALAAGASIYLNVYADVASGITNGDATADTLIELLAIDATGSSSATTVTVSAVTGQTTTWGTGTFTAATDGSTAVNRAVAGDQEVEGVKVRFTAQNETYTIKELRVSVASTTVASAVSSIRVYDGTTLLGTSTIGTYSTTAALVSGLSTDVSSNSYKTLTIKLVLNDIGTGAGTSQVNAVTTLANTLYQDSQGTQSNYTTASAGNELYVYKSIPTVTLVDLTNSTLVNGSATDLYKFTIDANSNGDVSVKQIKLPVSWSDGGTADTLEVESLKFYKDGTDITTSVAMQDEDGNSVESTSGLLEADETLVVAWSTEEVVSAGDSTTYIVRGTPQGFRLTGSDTVGDSVSLYLAGDAAHNGTSVFLNDETDIAAGQSGIFELFTSAAAASSNGTGNATQSSDGARFIWSDNNLSSHVTTANTTSSGDWANGYLILSLDLSGETWTK